MKKLKIVRIIARLNIGGPAQNVVFLTQGLNNDKFESILLSGNSSKMEGDMIYLAKERNMQLRLIPELVRELSFFKDTMAFLKILTFLFKEKPDIVHTHTAKAGALGRAAGFLYKVFGNRDLKLVHTFHGHVLEGYFGKLKNQIFIQIERILALFTDRIIVVSEAIREDLLRLGIGTTDRIVVIRLGLELEKFFNIQDNATSNNRIRVGIVGRLVAIKNHKFFIDVADLYLKLFPDFPIHFYIIGDGELRLELIKYVEGLGLSHSISFTGWEKDLVKVYSNLDIVCLTSLNEGTPVSIIEALASGKPIVSTNVGGIKDIVKPVCDQLGINESIILVEPGDKERFVDALRYFAANRHMRNSFGEKGRTFVQNNFLKERLIKDMDLLYTTISKRSEL